MSSEKQNSGADAEPDLRHPEIRKLLSRYWATNVVITLILLSIWSVVGLGCSVLFADRLNEYHLPGTGFPLGFWFAHQGSIIAFILLILTYCLLMNRVDAKHHVQLKELKMKMDES